jgi:RNA-binding protein YhbY
MVEISPFEELGRAVVSSLVSFLGSILVLFNTKKQNLPDYV